MIAITSRQSYLEIQPAIPKCKKIICHYLYNVGKASNRQIATATGLDLNNVTGRVNELVKSNILKFKERSPCPITGKNVYKWGLAVE